MVGRIVSILKALWARPAVQASIWIVIESIVIWLKDWIVSFFKKNSPRCQAPSSVDTPCNTRSEKKTTRRVSRPKKKLPQSDPVTLAKPVKRTTRRTKK